MAHPKRQRRQKKADRLLCPDASSSEIECDYGIAPMDRVATIMDLKWGIDRLPELVSPDMAAKYGRAMAHMNECIRLGDPANCAAAAQNCIKGLNAMDADAEQNGMDQATGTLFEFELDPSDGGEAFHFGVMEDGVQWQTAKAKRPDLMLFTKREIAMALQAYVRSPMVAATKDAFPGSEITKIKPNPPVDYKNGGDIIPF